MVLDSTARITEEGVADLKRRVGSYYSQRGGSHEITLDAIRRFVRGIGDRNPLYLDEEYARSSCWKGVVAPPTLLFAVGAPTGMRAGGMPGVQAFASGTNYEYYRPIRLGDVLTVTYRPADVVEKNSQMGGHSVIVYGEGEYFNQRDEKVARAVGWSIRVERKASQERGKYAGIKRHHYSEEELLKIYEGYDKEEIRGATPRYWEDVRVGDELPTLVKGPLTIGDMVAWRGVGGGGTALGLRVRELRRHPAFGWRDPKTGALQRISQIHEDDAAAAGSGVPVAYDIGVQRNCWFGQILTNWQGDHGFLKKLHAEYRRFNMYGDTQYGKARVTKKYQEEGEYLVDLDVWFENQRGEVTTPGLATVALPSRSGSLPKALK